jgi:hypothetical protein
MVDGIVWIVLGLIFGYAIGHNRASVTKERLYYQNQLKDKDNEIELIESKLANCKKWSKIIAEENAEYRRKNV